MIKFIERNGWCLARIKGSHRQYKHNTKTGLVTISGKLSDELAPGTQNSILRVPLFILGQIRKDEILFPMRQKKWGIATLFPLFLTILGAKYRFSG